MTKDATTKGTSSKEEIQLFFVAEVKFLDSSSENGWQTAGTSCGWSSADQAHFSIVFIDCNGISGSRENRVI